MRLCSVACLLYAIENWEQKDQNFFHGLEVELPFGKSGNTKCVGLASEGNVFILWSLFRNAKNKQYQYKQVMVFAWIVTNADPFTFHMDH